MRRRKENGGKLRERPPKLEPLHPTLNEHIGVAARVGIKLADPSLALPVFGMYARH